MPTPPMTEAVMAEAVAMVRKHGSIQAAAIAEGIPRQTLQTRIRRYEQMNGVFRADPPPSPQPEEKPRVRVAANTAEMRVLAIGDVHAGPGMPTDHLGWIGAFAADSGVTEIVQIGDFGTWDSVSRHDGNETLRGRLKPSFQQDEDANQIAYEALTSPLEKRGVNCRRTVTFGNHEGRVYEFVNAHPELRGDWDLRLEQLPARFGWSFVPYGDWLYLGAVGFTHVPMSPAGRPYMGRFSENQIANDAVHSIVFGHTHKHQCVRRAKIGKNQHITVLNLGTSMPEGYVADYAKLSPTGWTYGVAVITIKNGQIVGHEYVGMSTLKARYG